jgi:hypothetical protein
MLRSADRQARRAKLEALYNEYISLAAGLYVDALSHQTEDPSKMVPLYALGSRMRLVSARAVSDAANRIGDPSRTTALARRQSSSRLLGTSPNVLKTVASAKLPR